MGRTPILNVDVKKRNLESFGIKIKKYRKNADLTAEELAEALNCNLSTIRNWECGLSRPDPEYLIQMFSILNVDPNEFFGIKGVGSSLSDQEKLLLEHFRSMDIRARDDFLSIGETMADKCHFRKVSRVKNRIVPLRAKEYYAAAGAGDGWTQATDDEEVLLYDSELVREADGIITVSGHSMEPDYQDHDRILYKRCTDADVGKVYIFSVRGLGLVIKEAQEDKLHSLNPDYGDIVPWEEDGAELIGRVLGVIDQSMYPTAEEIELYREAMEV